MAETMQTFEEILKSKLENLDWQDLEPGKSSIGDTLTTLNVTSLFAANDSSGAKIFIKRFKPVITDLNNLSISMRSDTLINTEEYKLNIGTLGNVKEVIDFIDEEKIEMLEKIGPVNFINFLVTEIAAKNNPHKVGGPVDIIRLTKNDIQWINVKEKCR